MKKLVITYTSLAEFQFPSVSLKVRQCRAAFFFGEKGLQGLRCVEATHAIRHDVVLVGVSSYSSTLVGVINPKVLDAFPKQFHGNE